MSSDAAVHRFAALCAEASDKRGGAKVQPMRIHRSDDEIRTDAAVLEKRIAADLAPVVRALDRSEEHTSELQSLMRISYAVFCLKKQNNTINTATHHDYIKISLYQN